MLYPWLEEDPLLWQDTLERKHYIADYKKNVFVDGEGVRNSLYVSGCQFKCPGCFNKIAQNYNYGMPFTAELAKDIIEDLSPNYIQGITFLGGEPFLNTKVCLPLCLEIKKRYQKTKDIWAFTGYTFEQLFSLTDERRTFLNEIDVLVDGPFIQEQKRPMLAFRGSANQRIIDVQKSLQQQQVIEWQVK